MTRSVAVREEPCYFRNGSYSLFGMLHRPAADNGAPAFVFCHPFGEEKLWAHRVFVSFARELAASGHHVLRFDYMGHGDSDGVIGDASMATILSDVEHAVGHLRKDIGPRPVTLLGLRFGAMVAGLSAARIAAIDRLILWAPILDGGRYMHDMLRINLTTQMAVFKEIRQDRDAMVAAMQRGESVNVDGYDIRFPLYSEVAAASLAGILPGITVPCLVVHVDKRLGRPPDELQRLAHSCRMGRLVEAEEDPFWKEIPRFYDRADNLFRVTRAWLQDPVAPHDSQTT